MVFPDQSKRFDFIDNPEVLDLLEKEAAEVMGPEAYQELLTTTQTEIMNSNGTGDMPPGYDPETDPLRQREHQTARRVLIGTLATAGVVSVVGTIVAHSLKRRNESHQDED